MATIAEFNQPSASLGQREAALGLLCGVLINQPQAFTLEPATAEGLIRIKAPAPSLL
jgi:hypothetical protein